VPSSCSSVMAFMSCIFLSFPPIATTEGPMGSIALYEWVLVGYSTLMLGIEGSPPTMNSKQASQARSTGHFDQY
jgi:hypothetical protein